MPPFGLCDQLPVALRRESVEFRTAPEFGPTPPCLEPATPLHPMEGRVKGSLLHLDSGGGTLANPPANSVAVLGAPTQRLENQDVQGASDQIAIIKAQFDTQTS